MKVVVIGAGYVGLVTGACLSELGFDIWCVDTDESRIDSLIAGRSPIAEPDLEEMLVSNYKRGRLRFATNHAAAVKDADIVFIAVGTPEAADGSADLSHVLSAVSEVARHLTGYTVVVMKSTVPVGTARRVRRTIAQANPGANFDVASNPEFLREGAAVRDSMQPDRIIVGTDSHAARDRLRLLFRAFRLAGTPILECNPETAELAKYAANSFLAAKVAYINQVADICEIVHADIDGVAEAMGLDPRIGRDYLEAGPGFGGSCFPKDTNAFVRIGQDVGAPQTIVEAVAGANGARKRTLLGRIRRAAMGSICDKRIAVLGLAFKAGTDDVRDSPALELLPALAVEAREVVAHDPAAIDAARLRLGDDGIDYREKVDDAVTNADVTVILTGWPEYRRIDLDDLASRMRGEVVVDLRNLFDPADVSAAGLSYHCVGRAPEAAEDVRPAIAAVAAE